MDILLTFVLVLAGLYIFLHVRRKLKRFALIDKIPGPKPLPILGNILTFLVPREELLGTFLKLHATYGDIYRTWTGSRPVVHLVSPENMEIILGANKHIQKGHVYKFILPWLGTGLLTSSGRKWFTHRKLISPTFHFKILEGFVDVFNECSEVLAKTLKKRAYGNYFDICPYVTRCALDIICETAMGTRIQAQENEQSLYVAATLKVSELIVKRQFQMWLHPDSIYYKTKQGKEFTQNLKILHDFTESVIRNRKMQRKRSEDSETSDEKGDVGLKKRLAFLDLILEAAEGEKIPLTDLEIREEVDTFMFEGHDTTTTAISWTLLLLGNHMEIQEAVRSELESICPGQDSQIGLRELGEMKLLERVIKESLRLYPSVTMIARILDEDVQFGKYVVPAGTNIAMHLFNMHRNPNIYPDPLKFDPDRFLPENTQKRHRYAYLPFSAGQRNCIGQKFAMYEEKVMIAKILRNFSVEAQHTPAQVPTVHELVNRPFGGIHVKLTPVIRN